MKKRIAAMLMTLLLVTGMMPAMTYASGNDVAVAVSPSTTTANPGDTITFTVTVGPVDNLNSLEMHVNVPEGLTYLPSEGGAAGSALRTTMTSGGTFGWANASSMVINGYSDGVSTYTSASDTVIGTIVCTVNDGFIGTATLELTDLEFANGDFDILNATATSATVTVTEKVVAVTGVALDKTEMTVDQGSTGQLTAVVSPEDANNKNVTFTSSNTNVATVSADGKVTAVAEGTVDITVTTEDSSFTATCKVTVPHVHTYGTEWKYDGTNHWHECAADGAKADVAAHSGGTATCQAKAVCSVCGAEYGELAAHVFDAKVAEDKYLASAATCVSPAKYYVSCSVCGIAGTETFTYGEVNPDNHIGDTIVKNKKKATCEEAGYTGDTYCSSCNALISKGKEIPAKGHTLVKKEAVEATHAAAGSKEYYICTECGKLFEDAAGTKEITEADTVIPQIPHIFSEEWSFDKTSHWHECECGEKSDVQEHTFGEWKITKEATVTESGSKERVCSVCGYTEKEEIARLQAANDEKSSTNTSDTTPADKNVPATGDNNSMVLYVILLAAAVAALVVLLNIKYRRKGR